MRLTSVIVVGSILLLVGPLSGAAAQSAAEGEAPRAGWYVGRGPRLALGSRPRPRGLESGPALLSDGRVFRCEPCSRNLRLPLAVRRHRGCRRGVRAFGRADSSIAHAWNSRSRSGTTVSTRDFAVSPITMAYPWTPGAAARSYPIPRPRSTISPCAPCRSMRTTTFREGVPGDDSLPGRGAGFRVRHGGRGAFLQRV